MRVPALPASRCRRDDDHGACRLGNPEIDSCEQAAIVKRNIVSGLQPAPQRPFADLEALEALDSG